MARNEEFEVIVRLLEQDHKAVAYQLGLIGEPPTPISYELIKEAIGIADCLSRHNRDRGKQIVLTICALLWTH